MSVKYYPKITRTLLYVAHNKKRSLWTKKDDQYIQKLKDNLDFEAYFKWLTDDINYG